MIITAVEVCDGGWFMVVVIYPDSLQTNSAHNVKYAILLSFVYLQGESTAANILPEQIDLQSYNRHVVARWHHHLYLCHCMKLEVNNINIRVDFEGRLPMFT